MVMLKPIDQRHFCQIRAASAKLCHMHRYNLVDFIHFLSECIVQGFGNLVSTMHMMGTINAE